MNVYADLKAAAYEANQQLAASGLVIASFGNASAIDRARGVVAIKPSGVPYRELKPADIVVVDLAGDVIEGELRPSSDTPTHLALYRHFPRIGGIAHTHSTYAVAWAQAQQPIPILGTTHADHLPREVPCTSLMSAEMIAGDYEVETGRQIVAAFDDLSYEEVPMALVAGHGPFTWGATPEQAVYHSVMLEELARMALLTRQINPQILALPQALVDKHYQRKHGQHAYYGQRRKAD